MTDNCSSYFRLGSALAKSHLGWGLVLRLGLGMLPARRRLLYNEQYCDGISSSAS